MTTETRLTRLMQKLAASGLDGLVVNPGPSQVYLIGVHFYLFERPIVACFTPGRTPALILPELEVNKAQSAAIEMELYPYNDNPATWSTAFQKAIQSQGWHRLANPRIGAEEERLRLLEARYVQTALDQARLVNTTVLADLRMHKDAEEIRRIRQAVAIAEAGFNATIPLMKLGMTERELSEEFGFQVQRAGSEGPSYPMVAAGPNGSNPHATVSNRRLLAGDLLVIDFGALYQGYCSDLTRTLAIGDEILPEYETIVATTIAANAAGRAAARPGIPAGQVDQAARAVIDKAGYGRYFTHRTGHGLGSEPHEPPYIYGENPQVLEPGMVFTVEPGIYLPNRAGARVEDDVLVTADGAETLSTLPRQLIHVG